MSCQTKLKLTPFHQTIYKKQLVHTFKKRLVSIQEGMRKDSFWPFHSLPQVSIFKKVKFVPISFIMQWSRVFSEAVREYPGYIKTRPS